MKLTDEMLKMDQVLKDKCETFFNSHLYLDNIPRAPVTPIHTRCIKWTGARDGDYGMFSPSFSGQRFIRRAHIVSYMLFRGYVGNQLVLHLCQESLCVNPEHLVLGTHKLNSKHALMNRLTINPFNKVHKLLTKDVIRIRHLHKKYSYTPQILAEMYHVTPSYMKKILNRESWDI